MTLEKPTCPTSGNSQGTRMTIASGSEPKPTSSENDYTRTAQVYKIHPVSGIHVPTRLGANGQTIVSEAIKLTRKLEKNALVLPYLFVFEKGKNPVLECGKGLAAQREMTLPPVLHFDRKIQELGLSTLTIMRLPKDNMLYISYGRNGKIEFIAYVIFPFPGGERHDA